MARLARWLQLACFGVAISMLGYCAFVVVDTWMFQKEERRQFETLLADRTFAPSPPAAYNRVIGILTCRVSGFPWW